MADGESLIPLRGARYAPQYLRTGALALTAMTTHTPPAGFIRLVVGYDGTPPATRALDAAVRLLQGRTGRIDVVYVAHLSSAVMMSPGAITEMEAGFEQL